MVIGTLLRTLAPRAASAIGVRMVSGALNHLLAQHPNARRRLAAHQSRRICIGLDGNVAPVIGSFVPQPQAWFEITPDGELKSTQAGVADAQLLIKPSLQVAADMASSGTENLARHLRVEGDVMLAGLLGELIQDLSWDYEDDLSRVIGDIPARRVGEAVKRVSELGSRARNSVRSSRGDGEEAASGSDLPTSAGSTDSESFGVNATLLSWPEFDSLSSEISDLEQRLNSLEAKTPRN